MNISDGPFFSVIIVNWNGKHLIEECLDSLFGQTCLDFECIVVDNGSTDGSVEFLQERYGKRIRLVPLRSNTGYGAGNNSGIELALGKWVVFLNNDTQVDPRWLEEISAAIRRHPNTQIFACKILNYYRRDEIDNVGHIIYPDGINRGRGRLEKDRGQYDSEDEVFFPSGCASAWRKDLLDYIGGFDESFFAYGDDTELGIRARFYGAECLLAPKAVVYHKYSETGGGYSEFKVYQVERNRIWVVLKYFPLRWILLSPFYTIVRMAHHAAAVLRHKGAAGKFAERRSAWILARIVLRAYFDAFAQLPSVLAKRRKYRRLSMVPDEQFSDWMRRFRMTAKEVAWKE